jgi:ribosomal protein S11
MKVFVSSTSVDLSAHRAAAIRSLRRLGHQVSAMEDFTAATAYPLDRVLELVRTRTASC